MRKALLSLATLLMGCAASVGEVAAAEEQPYALVRRLQLLHDEAVGGNKGSLQQQEALLERTAQAIASASPEVWRDERNVRALAPYLVNGGSPIAVRRLLGRKIALGDLEKVVLALLAFAERRNDAGTLLSGLDGMALPPSVAAPVALAQGITFQAEPAKARSYLAAARLLAPGTMMDEAALRREIAMLLAEKQKSEAIACAARYLWRFGSSVYAGDVTAYLVRAVLPDLASKGVGGEQLQQFLSELPEDSGRAMLLDVARNSILTGKLDEVAFVTALAAKVSNDAPRDQTRARVYGAISKALSHDPGGATDEILSADRSLLADGDLGILDAALAISAQIQAPPVATDGSVDTASDTPQVVVTARSAVSRADKILTEQIP